MVGNLDNSGINFKNFENLSVITMIVGFPRDSSRSVIKVLAMWDHRLRVIGSGSNFKRTSC